MEVCVHLTIKVGMGFANDQSVNTIYFSKHMRTHGRNTCILAYGGRAIWLYVWSICVVTTMTNKLQM